MLSNLENNYITNGIHINNYVLAPAVPGGYGAQWRHYPMRRYFAGGLGGAVPEALLPLLPGNQPGAGLQRLYEGV